jgi:hypothetical protein
MAANTNDITKQVMDFQKNTFTSWFDAVSQMQDQAVSATETLMNQSGLASGENSKALEPWVEVFKNNRKNLKKQIDENFKQAEKLMRL